MLKSRFPFIAILACIAIFGVLLRLVSYDTLPPHGETADEFLYPWAGMSLITTGVPSSWSWFTSYSEGTVYNKWGGPFRIVSPWLEKPPLYSLLSGSWMLATGARDFFDVRLSVLRLLPITLSFVTIVLVGALAAKVLTPATGLLAALLYATIPTIAVSNRFSLTENLLTPLILLTLLAYYYFLESKRKLAFGLLLATGVFLAVLTKQIGISLLITISVLLLAQRTWKMLGLVVLAGLAGFGIYYGMGIYYGWEQFMRVQNEFQQVFTSAGLPELMASLFSFSTVGRKDHLLFDGSMLLGYLILFAAPLWTAVEIHTASLIGAARSKTFALFLFPFVFLVCLSLVASGAGFSFYGWHVFPLFPFITIFLAQMLLNYWRGKLSPFTSLIIFLFLASSTLRFGLTIFDQNHQISWQPQLMFLLCIIIGLELLPHKLRVKGLLTLFIVYLAINVLTVWRMGLFIPGIPQPL
ncbi:MAG: Glycosyl transferase family 39 [Candidatus Gottesmanbacteria bacterium GW2011_GWA1_43_11]|uniref:Glycosyl transferase family 39 n=1 Tax=Candidatus Gottesmanbacteria bacterium GW2011_GWA1_43_11 TaxID=1618436 RepID=A0A0G1EM24_9BACT|nr:MAG: Glycosyl transferase family 39 [Candidatus Gottesmanbacteria bacterium GW2011_GWA1_43_11]